jgi:hypothetical protein
VILRKFNAFAYFLSQTIINHISIATKYEHKRYHTGVAVQTETKLRGRGILNLPKLQIESTGDRITEPVREHKCKLQF